MCLGVPLRVSRVDGDTAVCHSRGDTTARRTVQTGLLDERPAVGQWLLVHVDVAIRSLDSAEALQIDDALNAVVAAAEGRPFEHLLADLIDREPELPPHLRPPVSGADNNQHKAIQEVNDA